MMGTMLIPIMPMEEMLTVWVKLGDFGGTGEAHRCHRGVVHDGVGRTAQQCAPVASHAAADAAIAKKNVSASASEEITIASAIERTTRAGE